MKKVFPYGYNVKAVLFISALLLLLACGSKKTQSERAEVADTVDSTAVKAKEEISNHIKNLYATIARGEENTDSFACQTWWKTVAAVEEKDAQVEEIGFFNDDLWTMMQDDLPDDFEVRDIKFQQLDVEKGVALVDFVLWSSIQTIHQKFAFCREDGNWRVHNIIRYFTDADGNEEESDLMEGMTNYLNEP